MGSPKVYVLLGFHTSFHHSWRGDTPDEAGFGTDIRVVRAILRILDRAAGRDLQARGYWDFDVYWTLQQILPHHAPDIVEAIRRRVAAGQDEIVPGPYNNGANHAATEQEFRMALRYALENPFGSGLKQVFGRVSSLYRPQESMYTAGQNAILLDEGMSGLVLYYAGVPFNALSTFVPALPPEQRYNLLWLRSRPDEPPVLLLPCISPADLVENVCLEALLLKLRRLQTDGSVDTDLLVHLNFDADGETWLPAPVPRAFAWFPNTGGLEEYIQVVNRYPWAEFTLPSEYLNSHAPVGSLLVRQDLADGGFDGNYSWAEKCTSLQNWTALERSRLHTYRAEALARRLPGALAADVRRRLWEGEDSVFFQRLVGLTTTHFGMSTPVINEARLAAAEQLLGSAEDRAAAAEREAALSVRDGPPSGEDVLYAFDVYRPAGDGDDEAGTARTIFRLPIILPRGVTHLHVAEEHGDPVAASLVNPSELVDGRRAGELLFVAELAPGASRSYRATPLRSVMPPPDTPHRLQNRWLELCLSPDSGVTSLAFLGQTIGDSRFLEPFITYRSHRHPQRWPAAGYRFDTFAGEAWCGLARSRVQTHIAMDTPHGPATSELQYTFTLFDDLPYLLVEVKVDYAHTTPEDTIHTLQQKLRQPLDLRWIEVAPFQINPAILASAGRPLRVWKHNYLGVTSYYDLDYGRVNARNRDLDSFNHQVTAGWVAVSDGQTGLLLAENAGVLASMAFCPMRLRQRGGIQHLSLNPFGSYHGRQLDYSHLGGNGVGAEFTVAISGSLRPNGPSFNGQRLAFSLLLAPYAGDDPPAAVQAEARAYFYPPGVIYRKTPDDPDLVVPGDLLQRIEADARAPAQERLQDTPLPAPRLLSAYAADSAIDLVWDAVPDPRVTGYQVRWREMSREISTAGGPCETLPQVTRWQVAGLQNGRRYAFRVRALAEDRQSGWTAEIEGVPGAVRATSLLSAAPGASPWTILRMIGHGLAHALRTRIGKPEP
jgi:hypothetical protein